MDDFYQGLLHDEATVLPYRASALVVIFLIAGGTLMQTGHFTLSHFGVLISQWISKWRFLFSGRDIIEKEHRKAGGAPFAIGTPEHKVHLVSTGQHMDELSNARSDTLSLFGAARETLLPRYTCAGFDIKPSKKESDTTFIRAIRAMTRHLPSLIPDFHRYVEEEVSAALTKSSNVLDGGFKATSLTGLVEKIQTRYNTLFFLGDKFASNEGFLQMSRKYIGQSHMLCEVVRLVPDALQSTLAWLIRGRDVSRKCAYDLMFNEVERRHKQMAQDMKAPAECPDLLQFIMQLCPPFWDMKRVTDEINFISYSTSILVSTTSSYAVQDLALRSEYISHLREELESMGDVYSMKLDELPILDSFIKESMRINCFEALSYRRLALADFTFFDGYKIAKGEWVGIPQLQMLRDDTNFPDPTHFDGFRFCNLPRTEAWKSTHYHQIWPFWGSQKQLCPGRHYVALGVKVIIAHLLLHYDIKIAEEPPLRSIKWRTARIPSPKTSLLIRPRQPKSGLVDST